jgi:hypothetical protein
VVQPPPPERAEVPAGPMTSTRSSYLEQHSSLFLDLPFIRFGPTLRFPLFFAQEFKTNQLVDAKKRKTFNSF